MTQPEIALLGLEITAPLSVVAIGVSIYASRISRSAHRLAKQAYDADRRILLKSERGEGCLILSPLTADQAVNSIVLYFPTKLGIPEIVLTSPDLRLFDTRIEHQVRGLWDSHTPVRPGFASVRLHSPVPVVAAVHGYAR